MYNILISSDKKLLNIPYIHKFISESYWAKGRSIETVETCVHHSQNFGVYLEHVQIGYARVVTDYAVFAYIMDLFIDEKHRGKEYAKVLIQHILTDTKLKEIKVWRLATADAHVLYQQFGFKPLAHPEKMMELIKN
jgi:GNAT superfamily N-acetyltransferase